MAKLSITQQGKHSISLMKDSDMQELYFQLKPGSKWRYKIFNHLMECITKKDLLDCGYEEDTGDNRREYIKNWLGSYPDGTI